jgi:uncharacterized membrane protein
MAIKSLRSERVRVTDIFEGFKLRNFFRSWAVALIFLVPYFILVYVDSLLGYIVLFLLLYTMPLLILRGYGAIASCKESSKIAIKNPVETLVITIIYFAVFYMGILSLLVGIFIAVPFLEIFCTAALLELIGERYGETEQEAVGPSHQEAASPISG